MKKLNLSIYRIFRKMGVPRNQISIKNNLFKDLGFDAFDMEIFLFFLESRFNITINDSDIKQLATIENTVNYIRVRTNIS